MSQYPEDVNGVNLRSAVYMKIMSNINLMKIMEPLLQTCRE